MISCAQRREERARTLAGLAEVGVTPIVTESPCNPAGGSLNRHAAWHAIAPHDEPLLFLEDDVDAAPWLPEAVRLASAWGRIVTLCLLRDSLLPDEVQTLITRASDSFPLCIIPLVPERVEARRGFYGTQAIVLPQGVVAAIRAAKRDFVRSDGTPDPSVEHGFDFWLKHHARDLGGIHALLPNPVQHRNPPKMRRVTRGQPPGSNPEAHRSSTYHLRPA